MVIFFLHVFITGNRYKNDDVYESRKTPATFAVERSMSDRQLVALIRVIPFKTCLVISVFLREKLKQLIEKRIGKENFVEKLGFITKHELYSRAAQKPQPVFPSPEQMLFDHEFTKLVKELEGQSETVFIIL